jgi:hypothetical protein
MQKLFKPLGTFNLITGIGPGVMIQDKLWFYSGYPPDDPHLPNPNNHDYPGEPRCNSFSSNIAFNATVADLRQWSLLDMESPSLYEPQLTRYWVPTQQFSHEFHWDQMEWQLPSSARAVLLTTKAKAKFQPIANYRTEVACSVTVHTNFDPFLITGGQSSQCAFTHAMDHQTNMVQEHIAHNTVAVWLDEAGKFLVNAEGGFLQYPGPNNDLGNSGAPEAYAYQFELMFMVSGYWDTPRRVVYTKEGDLFETTDPLDTTKETNP